jgi:glycosyltransferase involved in cell wall biosynthesis
MTARPRVLHLIPTMGAGGAERQLVLLAAALTERGWDVDVAFVHEGVNLAALQRTRADVRRLALRSNYDPRLLTALRRMVRERRPAVIQTWLPQMDIAGGVVSRTLGVPWVVAERSTQTLPDLHGKRLLRDLVIRGASAVISNSQEALRRWEARHPRVRRYFVPNAVEIEAIDAAAPAAVALALRGVEGNTRIVLTAGRLIEVKRFDRFIDVMKLVCARTDAVGVICGEGPLHAELFRRATAADIADRIVFAGFVHDMAGWMKAADVVVGLSDYEGRPNVIIEAMACRTPVVVTDIPEYRELVDETSARIVAAGEEQVAAAILDVLLDPAGAASRAAAARRHAEQWSPGDVATGHVAVYDEVLARRRPAG